MLIRISPFGFANPNLMSYDDIVVILMLVDGEVGSKCIRHFFAGLSSAPDQMIANGAMGSPEKAAAEKGHRLLELITSVLVEFLTEFPRWQRASFAMLAQ